METAPLTRPVWRVNIPRVKAKLGTILTAVGAIVFLLAVAVQLPSVVRTGLAPTGIAGILIGGYLNLRSMRPSADAHTPGLPLAYGSVPPGTHGHDHHVVHHGGFDGGFGGGHGGHHG